MKLLTDKGFSTFGNYLVLLMLSIVLAACGASGGAESETSIVPTPVNNQPTKARAQYPASAPRPENENVKFFKDYIWEELAATTCADCHVVGGKRAVLAFVHLTDVNKAFTSVDPELDRRGSNNELFIDLAEPEVSRLATRVGQGDHHCWLGNDKSSECQSAIVSYINAWKAATTPSSFMAKLKELAKEGGDITIGKQLTADVPVDGAYDNLHTLVKADGVANCARCHAPGRSVDLPAELEFSGPQRPYFAVDNAEESYDAIKSKIDINVSTNSRLYDRLFRESHQCWTANCLADAELLKEAIEDLADGLPVESPSDALLGVASKALVIDSDGVILNNEGARVDTNAVVLWEFKEPEAGSLEPLTTKNTSASSLAINADLTFSSNDEVEWWGAGGVTINAGRLTVGSDQSRSIAEALRQSGEYSIEAWVIPQDVSQGGDAKPASIVSFSGGVDSRFFMLSQREYSYDFYNRNGIAESVTQNGAGLPVLATDDEDNELEVAQASLQHVVATFSEVDGRRIYVNGELIIEEDNPELVGSFDDWQGTVTLNVGNETAGAADPDSDNYRQWKGAVRLIAIHNTALNIDDIKTNYEVGVGEKYYLTFAISHLVDDYDDLYVVFRVEQFDEYSYLFSEPLFYTKDGKADINNLPLAGIRIGINAREVTTGQAFINVNELINSGSDDYIFDREIDENGEEGTDITKNGGMQRLARIGTLIPQEKGIEEDEFFIYFSAIGDNTYNPDSPEYTAPETVFDDTPRSDIGLKNFAEINASLSALTGISSADDTVKATYESVQQQMPVSENIEGFVAAHQLGITQLAVSYCNVLTEAEAAKDAGTSLNDAGGYYPGFDFDNDVTAAFDSAGRSQIINPILDRLLANTVAVADQPAFADTEVLLDDLITGLINKCDDNSACDQDVLRVQSMVTAVCTAAFGSGLMLLQ